MYDSKEVTNQGEMIDDASSTSTNQQLAQMKLKQAHSQERSVKANNRYF